MAEHFCHLKNNPTISFSLINTLIIKQKKKISIFQMIIIYELLQKYIYYISANVKNDIENDINDNQNELTLSRQKEDYFKIILLILKQQLK